MDRWSATFSPNSLQGLTAIIWIRLPNLPLQCWDEVNFCIIASMVGIPYLIDGNMFQWSRSEFARVCVRIKLDEKLPMGVWVEGELGKFYQNIEYERLPTFCFICRKIGHLREECLKKSSANEPNPGDEDPISKGLEGNGDARKNCPKQSQLDNGKKDDDGEGYGPWINVDYKAKKINKKFL
ncbi:uncharacterized protein LOC110110215 [Dendrobium catenatum]|uniref:uncharacterized protein LOC110110215 n=1 Tax=Dendrobium catenatum TaxID=906689 RepID=UPI0009F21BC1|nr:uncharacterized protein LOC110110215 [Dendrobium catenatum]